MYSAIALIQLPLMIFDTIHNPVQSQVNNTAI
jgi:hypothetical protein